MIPCLICKEKPYIRIDGFSNPVAIFCQKLDGLAKHRFEVWGTTKKEAETNWNELMLDIASNIHSVSLDPSDYQYED